MYYEEQWIEGALCWRTSPDGAWTRYTANELAHRYESAEKRAADAQATVEALQREHSQLQALVREIKEEFDNCTHECERCGESDPLTTFDIYRTVVKAVTLDATTPDAGTT